VKSEHLNSEGQAEGLIGIVSTLFSGGFNFFLQDVFEAILLFEDAYQLVFAEALQTPKAYPFWFSLSYDIYFNFILWYLENEYNISVLAFSESTLSYFRLKSIQTYYHIIKLY